MSRVLLLSSLCLGLGMSSAMADEKAESCGYQADVANAIKEARLDRVKERNVEAHILAQDNGWPENFNAAIPLMTPWVYEMKRRDLKKDIGAAWLELCLGQ